LSNDSTVPDIPSSTFEEAAPDSQRLAMLPLALMLGLGLVLGYALGYVVGNREKAPTTVGSTAPPSSAEGQIPTSGTVSKEKEIVSKDTTVVVPAPPPVKSPAPAPPTPRVKPLATAGRLVVTSNPAKAAVTINGKWKGRTPLTLDNLKFGKYEVRVVQPGFEVAREQLTLSQSAASRAVDVTLRRVPTDKRAPAPEARTAQSPASASPAKPPVAASGAMFVDSRPQGARVFLDGKELGVTPLSLAALPTGSHVVRLELADHQSWTETTQVVGQKTAHVTGSLERIR
jgi:hypothetical protein